ncbi:MAG TPA: hypothetical protein VIX59_01130 [Candidatus Binataceae bacterium]
MATLIDSPEFTSNEIYQIQAIDPVQGAASGASFGGIGLSNQPHQQLANRTAFLKQRQDTNITNIGVLLNFMAGLVGSLQQEGYLKIPIMDINRGQVAGIIQWGLTTVSITDTGFVAVTTALPTTFPNVALFGVGTAAGSLSAAHIPVQVNVFSLSVSSIVFHVSGPPNLSGQPYGITGIYFLAIGF